jgi:hypothetical protein
MPSKVTLMPFDPELGKKFMAESKGRVIGRRKSSLQPSDTIGEEMLLGRTAQEEQEIVLHQWLERVTVTQEE